MKIATFNIQNLFHRDRSNSKKAFGKCMSDWVKELDDLLIKNTQNSSNSDRIQELTFLLGFDKTFHQPYAVMRRRAGFLFLKGKNYSKELAANEITDWNGWVSLQTVPIQRLTTVNKAKVIADMDPDILLLQEVEDRGSLEEFNEEFLPEMGCSPFDQIFVVQGNDYRGQEMAIMTKRGFELKAIRSHVHDRDRLGNPLFKKDLLEYEVKNPSGTTCHIISAYFQERTTDINSTDLVRKAQAIKTAEIYYNLQEDGKQNIAIVGTLNNVPYSDCLSPLLRETDLQDITKHASFNVDIDQGKDATYFRMGAYRMGVNIKQKDYLLLSPELYKKVNVCGLNRKALWPAMKPMWSVYSTVYDKTLQASEHPALWADIRI
ncbi:endonuclease/exonuclease/phosphatase family protein [Arenibacter latericius]|uniref:endonuclease/exonuclease/phosphatase family protein n=1 Tax=Arenibacter latericius TaxID=86104 RepID=UPI0003FF2353|nr:hypothetical protein [Arenibacter latericius]